MSLRRFLKPDLKKIVVFILLMIVVPLLYRFFTYPDLEWWRNYIFLGWITSIGFPVSCVGYMELAGCTQYKLSCYVILWDVCLFDTIVSYVLSCVIVWIYEKGRKR